MGTPFSDIYDQFMQYVKDYRLVVLYNASVTDFEQYLAGFLIPAITDFKSCNQSLAYATGSFSATLVQENIKILALLVKKYWLKKEIADVTQMSLHLQDKDFHNYAEANNLMAKEKLYRNDLEEVSQMLVEYGIENVDWASWLSGVFYTP